jgi:hypothetical protein
MSISIYKYYKDKPLCNCGNKLIPIQGPKLAWHFRHQGKCEKRLYISQRGAGNGKTWGIINMIQRDDFLKYTTFIYVTKQHSARAIIKDEFVTQYEAGLLNITNFRFQIMGKKYVIEYTNSRAIDCTIIIATIDSFFYCIGDKTVESYNLFEGIVHSVLDNPIIDTFQFAGKTISLSETMYVLDESQDTPDIYGKALLKMLQETKMTVYCVGDKVQSISNEKNTFTYLIQCSFSKHFEPAINICRRFSHPQLVDFVNYMVPFSKYDLPQVTPFHTPFHKQNDIDNALTIIFESGSIEEQIDELMKYYSQEVENGFMPQDFLIVTPFVSKNPLITCLNQAIQEFWIQRTGEYKVYSVFHKSEIGSSINLDESTYATRIVSIHSSKGDGRPCVFVIGLNETSLKTFSGLRDSLIYDSLLHVAITRMKSKLYITCNENDEIGQRIKTYLCKNNIPCKTNTLHIDPTVHIKNILPACGEKIDKIVKINKNVFDPMDIGNNLYTIKHGLILQRVCIGLKDQQYDRMPHIKVIHEIAYTAPIVICTNWKEYNIRLRMNIGTEKNEYKDRDTSVPLLKFSTNGKNSFETIYKKMNMIGNSCLDDVLFYYRSQVTSRGYFTNISILELYKIIDCDDFKDYSIKHMDCMKKVDSLVKQLIETYPKTSWNPDCSIQYGEEFILKTHVDLIGYNKDTVILCYVKPILNTMNFNELKIKSMVDAYLVSLSKNEKYVNKKIVVSFISFNVKQPIFIEYQSDSNDFILLKQILKETIYDYYSIKNKEVFHCKKIENPMPYIQRFLEKKGHIDVLNTELRLSLDKMF